MSLKVFQLSNLWFLLQTKQNKSAFFLEFLVTVIENGALNKSAFGSNKKNFSLKINSS